MLNALPIGGTFNSLHCPMIDIAGDVVLSMPPGTTPKAYSEIAARIFGESRE